MYPDGDPFGAPRGGGPGAPPPPGGFYGAPTDFGVVAPGSPHLPAHGSAINTFALLSPILGVLVPPAGVALGHLALPQIRRTGERGRGAALAGLAVGYLMCVVLVGALVWWLVGDAGTATAPTTGPSLTKLAAPTPASVPVPTTVTSVAAPVQPQRTKVDLATVPVGTCVEVQTRSTTSVYALDLFKVDCVRRSGVYAVSQRVSSPSQCASPYTAAPPDESFAVCLNLY